ncbi:mechanosensitive ion channel family protein [Rhodohalobacter sp. 8-1]|uniref:mechanosensitive ion channel family protein n=1 Tax=Rhodohalobacter sp. 8-1 TaxID=3131972 RepID=UPI0030EF1D92
MKTLILVIGLMGFVHSTTYAQDTTVLPDSVQQQTASAQESQAPDTSAQQPAASDTVQSGQTASGEGENSNADSTSGSSVGSTDIAEIRELISFGKVLYTLLILIVTYYINKYATVILDNLSEKTANYRLFIKRLSPISRIFIWSLAIYIIIAGVIMPPFETIITIAASVGIAVGFASQDILRNIFGGIMIILDRPFQVGDKIQVGDHYGEVLSIGLRSSRMVTPDDSVVSIPNGELMNSAVSNANSSALDCQVVAEIFLPATADVAKVKEIARKAVHSSSYSYLNKPVVVIVLNEMHDKKFVMKLRVKAYVLDIRYEFMFKSDMTEMILQECNMHGIIPQKSGNAQLQQRETGIS